MTWGVVRPTLLLPASAIERLETIAHLAVRLRETVRRLSSAAELREPSS